MVAGGYDSLPKKNTIIELHKTYRSGIVENCKVDPDVNKLRVRNGSTRLWVVPKPLARSWPASYN